MAFKDKREKRAGFHIHMPILNFQVGMWWVEEEEEKLCGPEVVTELFYQTEEHYEK